MRLIDADRFKNWIMDRYICFDHTLDDIDAQPTVDAVQVVRCKDCRFQDKGRNESESWNLCGYRPWLHVPTEDEHYCGYAERRADDE